MSKMWQYYSSWILPVIGYILLSISSRCNGIAPTAEMFIKRSNLVIYMAPASFGSTLPSSKVTTYKRIYELEGQTKDGCSNPVISTTKALSASYYLLIARGNCSFEQKVVNAVKLGASGVVIYNSLEGIYQGKQYADPRDYDCNKGVGYVHEIIQPIYSADMDDIMPDKCTKATGCDSGRCVLTNTTTPNGYKVCCAWDLYMSMSASTSEAKSIDVPVAFIRMTDVATLLSYPELVKGTMEVALFKRTSYAVQIATVLLWLLAVLTVAYGSTRAANEDRILYHREKSKKFSIPDTFASLTSTFQTYSNIASEDGHLVSHDHESDSDSNSPDRNKSIPRSNSFDSTAESTDGSIDISPTHAIGFIFISSAFLTLLYFVNMNKIVTFVYLFAAAFSCNMVYFHPLFTFFETKCSSLYEDPTESFLRPRSVEAQRPKRNAFLDPTTLSAAFCSVIVAGGFYYYRFDEWSFVLQDVMGIAVCVVFLTIVRLPNLKVATILLSLAFLYDVFFVFISPFIFKSSIMLKVVSGNSATITDENYCEKYPDSDVCETETLPMLLIMPTFSSFAASETMLGLGDIVLPGLLLAWAARYDMRRFGTLFSPQAQRGYFPMCLAGYGFGLLFANIAVQYFESGQPALFYIVPLTLGPTIYRAFKSETLRHLWDKLPPMNTVALPLDQEEQRSLLSRPDVVQTIASWDYKDGVVVLDRIETVTAVAGHQAIVSPEEYINVDRRSIT